MKRAIVYSKDDGRIVRYVEKACIKQCESSLSDDFAILEIVKGEIIDPDTHKVDVDNQVIISTGFYRGMDDIESDPSIPPPVGSIPPA